jgi:hypothetical protein
MLTLLNVKWEEFGDFENIRIIILAAGITFVPPYDGKFRNMDIAVCCLTTQSAAAKFTMLRNMPIRLPGKRHCRNSILMRGTNCDPAG